MAERHPLPLPSAVDTIIIGNGPSALILSYFLHGHLPSYDITNPHPDPTLHKKLLECSNLFEVDLPPLTDHFASSLRYSTQALPINTLLDTLLRPNADTEVVDVKSRLRWAHRPDLAITHAVLGDASRPGGQWVDNPVAASWNIGTLSYAEMLSLPGYSFAAHHLRTHHQVLPSFTRPNRREVADYFAAYPAAVGIEDSIFNLTKVGNVSRLSTGFLIGSHNIRCKNLVLASGTFSFSIPTPPLLRPLATLRSDLGLSEAPLLILGSGFTAADAILSTPPQRGILHLFRWAPDTRPSPLRGCHRSAYPEYAGMYRKMKLAATKASSSKAASASKRRKSYPLFSERDWGKTYEGIPNAEILDVVINKEVANVMIRLADGSLVERRISGLQYVVGRRGSLGYLSPGLQAEVLGPHDGASPDLGYGAQMVSVRSLREKAGKDLEVAPQIFITGSLTGDSLIRFTYGGCVYAAGKIIESSKSNSFPYSFDAEKRSLNASVNDKEILGASPKNNINGGIEVGVKGLLHTDPQLDKQSLARPTDFTDGDVHDWRHPVDTSDQLVASYGV
ncbi:MAG: hypothetical protein M1812_002368 [Candelaria pacifica]|nr:MAG: hypothetical protein M1812_002368 [Candelaria pacifica]